MKIYDEVTIDMNPESSNYGKHLSEDSQEYKGDIALCGSAEAPKITGGPRPGITAMGRASGMFPTSLDPGGAFIPGVVDSPSGKAIPWDPSLGAVDLEGYTRTKQGKFMGTGRRRTYDKRQEEAFSRDFREKWYDPYTEVALHDPLSQITQKGFMAATPEETGLTEDILSQLPTGMGNFSGTPVIEKSSVLGLRNLREDLDLAKGEAEAARTQGLEDIQIAQDEATRAKRKALQQGAIKRAQMARGTLAAEQQVRAPMGTSGFAFSGPQQQQIEQERQEGLGGFEDIGTSQREIEAKYKEDLAGFERGREDIETDYTEAIEGAEKDYGREASGALQSARDAVQDLMSGASDIITAHSQFGRNIVEGSGDPGWEGFGRAKHIYGAHGYGAPAEGWFRDTGSYDPTQTYLTKHFDAYGDIAGLTGAELLGTNTGEGDV